MRSIFKDAKEPADTIKAVLREESHGDLVEIEVEIQGIYPKPGFPEQIYLTKDDAKSLGELSISLAGDKESKS